MSCVRPVRVSTTSSVLTRPSQGSGGRLMGPGSDLDAGAERLPHITTRREGHGRRQRESSKLAGHEIGLILERRPPRREHLTRLVEERQAHPAGRRHGAGSRGREVDHGEHGSLQSRQAHHAERVRRPGSRCRRRRDRGAGRLIEGHETPGEAVEQLERAHEADAGARRHAVRRRAAGARFDAGPNAPSHHGRGAGGERGARGQIEVRRLTGREVRLRAGAGKRLLPPRPGTAA